MNKTPVSPLAPKGGFPEIPDISGVRFSAASAGIKYRGRDDVMLIECAPGSAIAGVFTKSATRSAPVLDCEAKIATGSELGYGAAIIVNAGNANAFTGSGGATAVKRITQSVADALNLPETRVYSASTGVIGEPLPDDRIRDVIGVLAEGLQHGKIEDAARAFMTTDTFPKGAYREVSLGGRQVKLAGIAKGSGMIAPNMATMLVYLVTDAEVDAATWQQTIADLTDQTFNRITVDSDTSTSDTLMAVATGMSEVDVTGVDAFNEALRDLMLDLAHQVVRDGEGATKFIEVNVKGAKNTADAQKIAFAIANSPLVKTAIAGEDPNWGRIVMAVGKSGAAADRDSLSIWFGDTLVAEKGWVAADYKEEDGAAHMAGEEIVITVDVGVGSAAGQAWTCDLTHGYITINADYRS